MQVSGTRQEPGDPTDVLILQPLMHCVPLQQRLCVKVPLSSSPTPHSGSAPTPPQPLPGLFTIVGCPGSVVMPRIVMTLHLFWRGSPSPAPPVVWHSSRCALRKSCTLPVAEPHLSGCLQPSLAALAPFHAVLT